MARRIKMTTTPPPGFVASFRGLLQEESELQSVHTNDGFDLNVYKMMKKSSYDFSKLPPLGSVLKARPYRLNNTEKIIQR